MGHTELGGIASRRKSECSMVRTVPVESELTVLPLFPDDWPFLLPCALWANSVGEADLVRNADWGYRSLETTPFLIPTSFGKREEESGSLSPLLSPGKRFPLHLF